MPPYTAATPGQQGFRFDRSGVRIPTIAISAWIPSQTVVGDVHRGTSLLATMRERWNLGPPLTARDAHARGFAGAHRLDASRPPEDWPEVVARPVPTMSESLLPLDAPLSPLGKALLTASLSLAQGSARTSPIIEAGGTLTGVAAIALAQEALGDVFPLMGADR